MVVRGYLSCLTCHKHHIVRIGMGEKDSQRHKFSCVNCGEEIEVGLDINRPELSWRIVFGQNAEPIEQDDSGPVVNLHADFVIPADMQGKEGVFPSLRFGPQIIEAKLKAREAAGLPPIATPNTRVVFNSLYAEWEALRTAWSLTRNGQAVIADAKVKEGGKRFYPSNPPTQLKDWLFRFASKLIFPAFKKRLKDLANAMNKASQSSGFEAFSKYYDSHMSKERGTRYFNLMVDYFASYDEFSQVQNLISNGIEVTDKDIASSSDFQKTRMFYGNAFEAFASQVDVLAYLNNLSAGRSFDTFATMSKEKYLLLDKPSRFGPFAKNHAFTAVCYEADNHVRNASHHGSFNFNQGSREISFQSGKGGKGPEKRISYTRYLVKCVTIFLQTMTLLTADLTLAESARSRPPL